MTDSQPLRRPDLMLFTLEIAVAYIPRRLRQPDPSRLAPHGLGEELLFPTARFRPQGNIQHLSRRPLTKRTRARSAATRFPDLVSLIDPHSPTLCELTFPDQRVLTDVATCRANKSRPRLSLVNPSARF
jgi:hypothetical protein